jgi:hypothetical protein
VRAGAERASGGLGWIAGPSSWLGGLLLSFFFFFSVFHFFSIFFEFKFGLKFEFQTDVTYSLVFREFCLAILYIHIGVVCYIYRISFSFIQLSLDLNSDYFMVCFLEKVVKHNIKQKKIQITI